MSGIAPFNHPSFKDYPKPAQDGAAELLAMANRVDELAKESSMGAWLKTLAAELRSASRSFAPTTVKHTPSDENGEIPDDPGI
jgi:hypothetical protein